MLLGVLGWVFVRIFLYFHCYKQVLPLTKPINYDFTLHYHPSKANVVADALSRNSWGVRTSVASREWQMLETMGQFRLQYSD